jgi:hypothetical protein
VKPARDNRHQPTGQEPGNRNEEARGNKENRIGVPGKELLWPKREDGDIDFAVVCTPTNMRTQVVLPLVDAGVPVFCEKPFAETYAEAREMASAARVSGIPVAIDQNFRRFFAFAKARDMGLKLSVHNHAGQPVMNRRDFDIFFGAMEKCYGFLARESAKESKHECGQGQ